MNESGDLIKVWVPLNPDSWHGATSEGVWAKIVTPIGGKAIALVDNIPFFCKGICLNDQVAVTFLGDNVLFDSVVDRGGHSTYRIFFGERTELNLRQLSTLKALGCDWERSDFNGGDLFALDVPPKADIYEVYDILGKGKENGTWLFEEGYVGHRLHGDKGSIVS